MSSDERCARVLMAQFQSPLWTHTSGHMRFDPFDCADLEYDPVWQTCEIPTSHLIEVTSLNGFRRGVMWQPADANRCESRPLDAL
ncbi:hypothetical protein TNCV_770181 [Trichonephila clavipes]|nr:hypothetical protein TNCV_770181 [Trichonephila clavipes]